MNVPLRIPVRPVSWEHGEGTVSLRTKVLVVVALLASVVLAIWLVYRPWPQGVGTPLAFLAVGKGGAGIPDATPSGSDWPACLPKSWLLENLGTGHWILDTTDESWGWYMEFLNVSREAWPAEFHASDIHQYSFFENSSGLFYIMNHTIPATGFHLLYEADSNGNWVRNPYPVLTPAVMDPHAAKVDLQKVRYVFEEPGVPLADSCWAWRTDMPMLKSVTVRGQAVQKEFVVTFWRELTSPKDMRCTLYVMDAETGKAIAPWDEPGLGPGPSAAIGGAPKRLAYRYFRRAVQSFGDASQRLGCRRTGLPGDGHQFC